MPLDMGTLKEIPFSAITLSWEERGRKTYNNIETLAESIRDNGLICPLAVYSPTGEAPFLLVSGGRRYKALESLKAKTVAVRIFDHALTATELTMLELYENLHREDLTWPEHLALTKKINDAFIEQKGPKVARSMNDPGHSQRDTAKILGISPAKLSADLKMAETIEKFPELGLQFAQKQSEATTQMKGLSRMITTRVVAEEIQKKGPTPLMDSYIVGDFFENALPEHTFQFLEVDPPYGVDLHLNKKNSTPKMGEYQEVSKADYVFFMRDLILECTRLAAKDSWMILWLGPQYYTVVTEILEPLKWRFATLPALWLKYAGSSGGQTQSSQLILGSAYEEFIYASRGDVQLQKQGRSNVFFNPPVPPSEKIHPTERPKSLIKDILGTFCWPKSNILVPFAGSGATLIAAAEEGHSVVGFDLSPEYKNAFMAKIGGKNE